ncbi:SGNH/GDSL hydrolase family protein [Anseongella ginsenosidimutans]|nr:GDSL-type esterase/lipase family protein [Anseongella ginsenosidimutans]QEC52421.1 SGNH/GDSL hydrolase family protein [Anseongella ginsenosidimutans]
MNKISPLVLVLLLAGLSAGGQLQAVSPEVIPGSGIHPDSAAGAGSYLDSVKAELQKQWPHNRTINLVFHGHSVPSGYFKTPEVRTFDAYPYLVLKELKSLYPNAVINVIVTAIGGENSVQGAKRFRDEVLSHRPDVLFIDYALNDRGPGIEKSRAAWEEMIARALENDVKVILLTPSPDLRVDIGQAGNELEKFTGMIRELAKKHRVGLADSYGQFRRAALAGKDLEEFMSQVNHPNRKGHELIAAEIMEYFK